MKNFETKQQVVDYLKAQGLKSDDSGAVFFRPGAYYLNHGEYSRADYRPRKYGKVWGIHRTVYYYEGTLFAPRSGRFCFKE